MEDNKLFIILGVVFLLVVILGSSVFFIIKFGTFQGFSYQGIFYNFNPDYSKTLTGTNYDILVKSTHNIDEFSYTGYDGDKISFNRQLYTFENLPNNRDSSSFFGGHASVSRTNQIESFTNGNMEMDLKIEAKSTSTSIDSGSIGTMIITDGLSLDFNKVKSVSFDYTITESLEGACRTSATSGNLVGGSATTNINIGITSSKRNFIAIEDEIDFKCSPDTKIISGSHIIDSSLIDIPSDVLYEFFAYGNINGGSYSSVGVSSNLKIKITNINIIEEEQIEEIINETIEEETTDVEEVVTLEDINLVQNQLDDEVTSVSQISQNTGLSEEKVRFILDLDLVEEESILLNVMFWSIIAILILVVIFFIVLMVRRN